MTGQVHKLCYGASGEVALELEGDCLVADCHVLGEPLADVVSATLAALREPIDFPPVCRACVPGDRVAIAIDGDVPQAESIVRGALQALREGAGDVSVSVLCVSQSMANRLEAAGIEGVQWHDPGDEESMTYLAAAKDGQPIYFNRLLQEADVVIPVGALRPRDSLGYVGVSGSLFPAFSDSRTQARFRAPSSAQHAAHRRRRKEEAAEATWLLGMQFTIQVIPGPGDSVMRVLAGDGQRVEQTGRELCESAWLFRAPRLASLVIAAIDGGDEQQTWENFGRALHAARQAADDDADIVLCTDLQCAPGPALRQLAGVASGDELQRELTRRHGADAVPATVLHDVLQSSRVYLLSRLRVDQVEDLGLGHVASHEDLVRLVRQHSACTLIPSAHRAMVSTR